MKCLNETGLKHLIEKIRTEQRQLKKMINAIGTKDPIVASWKDVQTIVREGRAAEEFTIGDRFVCNHSEFGEILWDVVGIDSDTAADGTSHTMTLQTHDLIPAHIFDASEAFYRASAELPTGTYCFKLNDGFRPEEGGGQYVHFTTLKSILPGEILKFDWKEGTSADQCCVIVHPSANDISMTGSYNVSFGQTGTELTGVRHSSYCRGNNLWTESALWKYLNGTSWSPSGVYDVRHSEIPQFFQDGLDADFLSVLGKLRVFDQDAAKNDAFYSKELFTLPSFGKVNGGNGPCEYDTVAYPYYEGETPGTGAQLKRIKTLNDTAASYFLRTPAPDGFGSVYCVSPTGSISTAPANSVLGIAPICCIM